MESHVVSIRIKIRSKLETIHQSLQDFIKKHPGVLRVYAIFAWLSLCAFILSLIFLEDSRRMFVQFLWSFYVILQFWLLCRSKTLTWKKYTYFFLAGAWLMTPINTIIVSSFTTLFGGREADVWSMAILTPIVEEIVKLIPLGAYLYFSRRATSLSLSDFALIGAATGAGFQFLEETFRRFVTGDHYGVTLLQGKVLHWEFFTLFPGYFEEGFLPDKMTAGHSLLTAMVALGIGLAIRYRERFKQFTYIFPSFLLAWAIFDHAIWNSFYSAPGWITAIHDLLGSGYAAKPLFLIMLAISIFLDYKSLNRVGGKLLLLNGEHVINPFSEMWNLVISITTDRKRFGYFLMFYRERRELGFTLLHGNSEAESLVPRIQKNIQQYYKALAVIALALFAALFLKEWIDSHHTPQGCIACLFDQLQNWWDRLSGLEKAIIIGGAFALTFPLLGFWASIGAVTTGIGVAAGGQGIADIIRNPKKLLTPETALAVGVSAILSRIPFANALKKFGDPIASKLKKYWDDLIGKKGNDPDPPDKTVAPNPKVGDFTNVKNIEDFRARIPEDAEQLPWKEIPGGAAEGEKYRWTDQSGNVWNTRAHGPDPSAPEGSNAANGWIYRVEVKTPSGKWTMDSHGNFHKKNVFNPKSPHYSESIANDSHIPFKD
ncbi:polymorphic toxin type 30 domain-containing protein [Bacillus sp. Marseille-Q3570]|uniref:polymorphic toxin type 30 domain-containing protein n=1 Tax=Bacillus sp. Marseille-Q3570 TaxID=2963522 RepID=UPI0028DC1306|nr:polymorphic toxin type 30 domain-containing protein [Bacillus sp. Marseille-Q3570]